MLRMKKKFEAVGESTAWVRCGLTIAAIVAGILAGAGSAQAQTKLGPAAPVTYDNKYEVYGGLNFMNFKAGENLPKRMNLGGGEFLGTYWLTPKWGLGAEYRGEAGTTQVFPERRDLRHPSAAGVHEYGAVRRAVSRAEEPARGDELPCVRRHCRSGVFDAGTQGAGPGDQVHATQNAQLVGLYSEPHRSDLCAGRQPRLQPLEELGASAFAGPDPGALRQ